MIEPTGRERPASSPAAVMATAERGTWIARSEIEADAFEVARTVLDLLEAQLEEVTEIGLRLYLHRMDDVEAEAVVDKLVTRHRLVWVPMEE